MIGGAPRSPALLGARSGLGWLAAAFLIAGAAAFAALLGAVAGLGNLIAMLPFVLLIGAAVLAFSPATWQVWGMVVLSMLVVGPAIYFANIDSARWIVPALGLGLLLPAMLHLVRPRDRAAPQGPLPAGFMVLALFVVAAMLSTAINRSAPGDWISFIRYYLIMLPLVLLLAAGGFDARQWRAVWLFYIAVAVLQLPVALLQHFVFAARQVRSADWDAVVGTFPGSAEGGGASAAMGTYLIIALVFALMLWRQKLLHGRWAALVLVSALGTIAVAEVKAVVLLLGLALFMVFFDQIRRRPLRALSALVAGVLATGVLLTVYQRIHYDNRTVMGQLTAPRTPWEAIQNQFDPDQASVYTGQLSRAAAMTHWWEVNGHAGHWREALLGYGGAATQVNRFNLGELVLRYRHALNQTSSGVLLWEFGLLGHGLLALGMLMVAASAWRLQKREGVDATTAALLRASAVALLLFVLTLPYKAFLINTAPTQVLFALLLGFVAHAHRLHGHASSARDQRIGELRRASVGRLA